MIVYYKQDYDDYYDYTTQKNYRREKIREIFGDSIDIKIGKTLSDKEIKEEEKRDKQEANDLSNKILNIVNRERKQKAEQKTKETKAKQKINKKLKTIKNNIKAIKKGCCYLKREYEHYIKYRIKLFSRIKKESYQKQIKELKQRIKENNKKANETINNLLSDNNKLRKQIEYLNKQSFNFNNLTQREKNKIFLSFFPQEVKIKLCRKLIDMKRRCYNKNNKDYNLYGGAGITICKEWLEDTTNFYVWALTNGFNLKRDYSIDRINNNKGYEPNNCRFVSLQEQNFNRSGLYGPHYETININGKDTVLSIKQWSLYFQVSYDYIKWLFKKKETGGKGLKGQEIIDYLKEHKKGIYSNIKKIDVA